MGMISLGDVLQLVAIVFFAGAFWQRTGMLNDTLKKAEESFERSIEKLTDRVNEQGVEIAQIRGRLERGAL